MKIDLQNNYETYVKETQQHYAITRWCSRRGIPASLINGHPFFDDVVLLIKVFDEYEVELKSNRSYYASFNAFWGWVYSTRHALNERGLTKLERIVQGCITLRQEQQARVEKIKSLRLTGTTQTKYIDQDNEAKGSCLPPVTYTKREQQECRRVSRT